MKKAYLAISTAFVAFTAQPLQITDLAHFDAAGLFASAEAGNGHGGGNGNGGNNGGGRGNSGNVGNAGSHGHAGNGFGDVSDNSDDSADTGAEISLANVNSDSGRAVGQSKEKNLHAQLGRLNSLQRNINGIMKSNDPHLAQIRTFILNSVELTKAQAAEAQAQTAYDSALAAYTAAGLLGDPATTLASLQTEVATLTDQTAIDAMNAQISVVTALMDAQTSLDAAQATVAQYEALTSDAVLTDALLSGSNKGVVTPAMLDWSKSVLGVGDQTGAIDAYMAKFQ